MDTPLEIWSRHWRGPIYGPCLIHSRDGAEVRNVKTGEVTVISPGERVVIDKDSNARRRMRE